MSIAGMLFADKEVPLQLRVRDGSGYRKVPDEPMEPGHWDMWNKRFSDIPPSLPRYHYMFFFGEYGQGKTGARRNGSGRTPRGTGCSSSASSGNTAWSRCT